MRGLLGLLAVVVLVVIAAIALGFINIGQTQPGKLPEVTGGQLPKFEADVADVDVGTKNTTIEVPTVQTETKTVEVPTVDVKKAGEK